MLIEKLVVIHKTGSTPPETVNEPNHSHSRNVQKFGHARGFGDMLSDRQTDRRIDTQTDVRITILCTP